ncbi:cell wall biogenesis protein [Penicillium cinerascens]|uniref:Cell wall biogenesis protein n=1 Tax=Penicillium cinerascens TaxID=70096 RepID=A0A9W9NBS7_9EURO|nr:cell wall biogenesis protein [Penicillium cinerascens]KAJ5216009.1 cell wall biogenesis protein [Penicillium cinerascens]
MAFAPPALIGSQNASFSQQIADIQRLIQQSGLKFVMHATGTTLEGTWDEVSRLIGFAHSLVHQEGIARVQTDIRVQTRYSTLALMSDNSNTHSVDRTDKVQPMEGFVSSVEAILSAT